MAQVLKKRRLVNPSGRRRRRMTANQIKFFGTRRQKAALQNRRRRRNLGPRRRRHNQGTGVVGQVERAAERAIDSIEEVAEQALGGVTSNRGRRRNVGEILTVVPANPGRRRNRRMARVANRRRNRTRTTNRRHNRSRRRSRARVVNRRHRSRTRMSNPKVVVRYRNRRHNRRNRGRRRNPGILNGDAGKVASLVGGIAVTGLITGFLPSTLTSGVLGSVTTGVVAVVAGQLAGKMMKSPQMGNWVTIGGLLIVGLQLWQQFFPQYPLAITTGGTSTGTSGMGLITSSNFYVPQVNVPGSMATFVTPAGIPVAVPTAAVPTAAGMSALRGLGATRMNSMNSAMRRIGRLR